MKECTVCKNTKPLSEFYKHIRDGHFSRCKDCSKKHTYEWAKQDRKKNPEKYKKLDARRWKNRKWTPEIRRHYHLRRKYGISLEEYNSMLDGQSGLCKICKRHHTELTEPMSVDHCHTTGAIRGILCNRCNRGIGFLRDDPVLVARALAYLS